MTLHDDALLIARRAIDAAMPDAAVRRALAAHRDFLNAPGRLILVAVGKAAWTMARAALQRSVTASKLRAAISPAVQS